MKTKTLVYLVYGGVSLITFISLILALILDCAIFGKYIAIFDMVAIFLWIGLILSINYFKKNKNAQ